MNHLLFVHVSKAGCIFGLGQRMKLMHVFSQSVSCWLEQYDPGDFAKFSLNSKAFVMLNNFLKP